MHLQDAWTPLKVAAAVAALNLAGDYYLIIHKRLGVIGAGITCPIAQYFGAVAFLVYLQLMGRRDKGIPLSWQVGHVDSGLTMHCTFAKRLFCMMLLMIIIIIMITIIIIDTLCHDPVMIDSKQTGHRQCFCVTDLGVKRHLYSPSCKTAAQMHRRPFHAKWLQSSVHRPGIGLGVYVQEAGIQRGTVLLIKSAGCIVQSRNRLIPAYVRIG